MTKKEIENLKALGFREETDQGNSWYRKDIKHPMLTGLHIIVESHVTVFVDEPNVKMSDGLCNGSGESVIIHEAENSQLSTVLNWLQG